MPKFSPPFIESGTLPAVGSGQRLNLLNVIEHTILAATRTSDSTTAWSIYDDLTSGGVYDKVFLSSGSLADTKIYVRLTDDASAGIDIRTYTDWSNANNKGSGESFTDTAAISDTSEVGFYNVVDPDAFTCVVDEAGSWDAIYGGSLIRDGTTAQNNTGRAYLTSPITSSGANITFDVDRDLTSYMFSGSQGWIVNQTPSGTDLQGHVVSIGRVTNVTDSTITMANVANTHSSDSVFGVMPVYNCCDAGANGAGTSMVVGIRTTGTGSAETLTEQAKGTNINMEVANDPNVYGRFSAAHINFDSLTKVGSLRHWVYVADDTNWTIYDLIRVNFDNGRVYKVYPDLTLLGFVGCLPDTGTVS